MYTVDKKDRICYGICLIAGQSMQTLSSFFWLNTGRYDVNGSVIIILAMVFWATGFIGLFQFFKERNPWYARLGLMYAFYGCLGGIGFGFEGLYSQIFGIEKIGVSAFEKFPLQMDLVLYWAGPAFPLTLLVMGIMLLVRRVQPWWIGALIALGAIAFPVSRILRIVWVAHVADVILLIPMLVISVHFISRDVAYEKSLHT